METSEPSILVKRSQFLEMSLMITRLAQGHDATKHAISKASDENDALLRIFKVLFKTDTLLEEYKDKVLKWRKEYEDLQEIRKTSSKN